ncbi:MAG: hypothetical protein JW827_07855 [Spirochaetes bacterium]|nr:hypothetical protein [Spirochaetota bacterium]
MNLNLNNFLNQLNMRIFVILLIVILSVTTCGKKEKKIRLDKNISGEGKDFKQVVSMEDRLNPEIFFTISIKVNELTMQYGEQLGSASEEDAKKVIEELNNKIKELYGQYGLTEAEMSRYSDAHYKELEEYLRNHPETEEKLQRR